MDYKRLNEALEDAAARLRGRRPTTFWRRANSVLESARHLLEGDDGMDSMAHRQVDAVQLAGHPGMPECGEVAERMAADIAAEVLATFPHLQLDASGASPSVTSPDGASVVLTTSGESSRGHAVRAYAPAQGRYARADEPGNLSVQPHVPVEDGLLDGEYNPDWLAHSRTGQALVLNVARQLGADLPPGRPA